MVAADRASWQNPRVLLVLLLVFVCGALAGAITMRTRMRDRFQRGTPYWTVRDDNAQFSYDKLKRELNLTPDQSDRMKSILDDFDKYHEDLEVQIEDVRATGKNRILQILTATQRKRFEEMCSQLPAR